MSQQKWSAYQGISCEYETLLGVFDKDNATFQKRVGTDRVKGTYMTRVRARNHVAAFIKEFAVLLSTDRGLQNGSI